MKKVYLVLLLSLASCALFAQSALTGKVVAKKSGEPIIGATVIIDGTMTGSVTDGNGDFSLTISKDELLNVSFIGMKEKQVPVTPSMSHVLIEMDENELMVDDVVVVGYGKQKVGNVTGAIADLKVAEIDAIPASNLSNAIAGRISGVTVTQATGKPGVGSDIKVRAAGTWNNSSPLYVIDGIVRDKFAFDGLDSNNIESLTVLKDGASAAVYGARAANGVVLVTTKSGKSGKPMVSYQGTVGFSEALNIPEMASSFDQARLINENIRRQGAADNDARYFAPDELEYYKTYNNSWLDEAWRTPVVTRHAVSVSGGSEVVRYYVGGNYYYESGSFDNLDFNKTNFIAKVDANITKNLVIGLSLSTDTRNDYKPYWRYDNDSDVMEDLYKGLLFRSNMLPSYIDGKPNGRYVEWHPLEIIDEGTGYTRKRWTNVNTDVFIKYDIPGVKGLSAKFVYNNYNRQQFTKQFNRPYTLYNFNTLGTNNHIVGNQIVSTKVRNDGDYLIERYDNQKSYQINGYLTYDRTFGKHDIGALFVYEQSEGTIDWFNGQREDFISSAIDQMFAGSADRLKSAVNGSGSEDGRMSYVGRVNYGYDNRYIVEASFRYDGSMRFAPNERWGFFPSVSAAWRISEEQFFKNNVSWVDYLKLRASVGLLGNDDVGGWQWQQAYKFTDGAYFGTLQPGVAAGSLANPYITWEKSLSYNVGLDATFLNNKITFAIEGFYKKTYDILGSRIASLPSTFGATMPAENYAKMSTKGFELELGYNSRNGGSFEYYVKGNVGYATNNVIQKDEAQNLRSYKSEIGYNTGRIMGYRAKDILRTQADVDALPEDYTIFGLKPTVGMLNYQDIRGANQDTPDGKIDDQDQEYIYRYSQPPLNYGLLLGGTWKGIGVDIFFQGFAGHHIMMDGQGRNPQARIEENNFAHWADFYTPNNINAKYPSPYQGQGGEVSTFWAQKGSFMRIKNLSVSYTLPSKLTKKIKASDIKIFFIGTNLGMIYSSVKYRDPEVKSIVSYPLMRNYSFGVNLNF